MQPVKIAQDKRPIQGLTNHHAGVDVAWIGQRGVTAILVYEEDVPTGTVAFYAVMKGKHLHERIPAFEVGVTYQAPLPQPVS